MRHIKTLLRSIDFHFNLELREYEIINVFWKHKTAKVCIYKYGSWSGSGFYERHDPNPIRTPESGYKIYQQFVFKNKT